MSKIFGSFLFKLILTVAISVFIGFQISKIDPELASKYGIEFKEASHSFRKILSAGGKSKNLVDNKLQSRIEDYLSGKDGDYAIYVKDLMPGGKRNVCINCEEVLEAASLYKVFLMAAVFNAVNEGKFDLDTQIGAKLSHLDQILGGRDFGYEDFDPDETIGHTVREALARVAAFSDNYAAILLAEKVGWDQIQQMADEVGATKTSIKNPITTSAEDIGLILEKLYKGEVVSLESSEQILDLLSKSQMNNRIPAKLPKEIRIAHKTGELAGVRNDAGIVFLDGNPYVIVEMSKNLVGEDEGVENLAEISRIVYDYYAANPGEKR